MERDDSGRLFSAVIAEKTGVPVWSVVNLSDIVGFIREAGATSLGIPEDVLGRLALLAQPGGS
jgi:hypothetical protein